MNNDRKLVRTHFIYDGSYEGFLSVIYQIYAQKLHPDSITPIARCQTALFTQRMAVATSQDLADRVLAGLARYFSNAGLLNLYKTFLSEVPGIELILYQNVHYALQNKLSPEENFAFEPALVVKQYVKKINREVHRMHAFVRFEQLQDGLFVATIQPDFHVMPLIGDHFLKRYADQSWLIYDTKRNIGLHYDKTELRDVVLEASQLKGPAGTVPQELHSEQEQLYRRLWQQYFKSTSIQERKNTQLHLRHVPRRYWKFLSEKQEPITPLIDAATLPSTSRNRNAS